MGAATMTLIGLYNYDSTIFDNLTVPASLDKDTLVNNILLRSGDFEVLYPRPDFLKAAVGVWSNKWQATMEKWAEALSIDYEPLQNYDRTENWTDTKTGTSKNVKSGNVKEQSDGGNTTTNEVSAFDGGTAYTPHDKETFDTDQSNTTTFNDVQDQLTNNTSDGHTGHVYGNIGVTTSQQMLEAELKIRAWNIYEHITDLFLTEFVLPIY